MQVVRPSARRVIPQMVPDSKRRLLPRFPSSWLRPRRGAGVRGHGQWLRYSEARIISSSAATSPALRSCGSTRLSR